MLISNSAVCLGFWDGGTPNQFSSYRHEDGVSSYA